jgi:hypothetical protein
MLGCTMNEFLATLDALNRKERYFVFTQATDNAELRLGPTFRRTLSTAVGFEVPESSRAYIDYHIDWIHAAVELARNPG